MILLPGNVVMSLSADLSQLAHLVRLSAEEARSFTDIAEDARVQLRLIADRALAMASELETLAARAAPLVCDVGSRVTESRGRHRLPND